MNELINSLVGFEFILCAQPLPQRLLAALEQAAKKNKVMLDVEIIMRILATLLDPEAFGRKRTLQPIRKQRKQPLH